MSADLDLELETSGPAAPSALAEEDCRETATMSGFNVKLSGVRGAPSVTYLARIR